MCSLVFLPAFFWDKVLPSTLSFFSSTISTSPVSSTSNNIPTIYTKEEEVWRAVVIYCTFFVRGNPTIVDAGETWDRWTPKSFPDVEGKVKQAPTAEAVEIDTGIPDEEVLVVDYKGSRYYGYLAVLSIIDASIFWFLARPLLNTKIRAIFTYVTMVLRAIESNYEVLNSWIYPSQPRRFRRSKIVEVAALLFLLYVVNWNFATFYAYPVSPKIHWIGPTLRIDQWWGMFAPHPPKESGWFVVHGKLSDGTEVDVLKGGGPVSFAKPELFSATMPAQRWRTYLLGMTSSRLADKRLHYGRYLCREWNFWGRHPQGQQLKSFKIMYFRQETRLNYEKSETLTSVLWDHACF